VTLTVAFTLSVGCEPDVIGDVDPPTEGAILDVAVTVPERAVLTAVLSWSTTAPASSWVEVSRDGEVLHRVGDDGPRVDHEVAVVGLRPESSYTLIAASRDEDGSTLRSAPLAHATGPLPIPELTFAVDVHDPDAMEPGWTLLNVVASGDGDHPRLLLMIDEEAQPVWSYQLEGDGTGRGDLVASLVDGERVLAGGGTAPASPVEVDLAGRVLWEGPPQEDSDFMVVGQMHHDFERLDNDDYLTLEWAYEDGTYDVIVEFDADHHRVWEWDFREHVPEQSSYIWCNAVQVDLDEDVAYLNGVANGTLYKIDRPTGDVLWRLGKHGDFTNPQDVEYPFAWGSHGFDRLPDGNVLFYDNGHDDRGFSRVAEWSLDEGARVAEIVFEYPGPDVDDLFVNPVGGDADRLVNGNTLVLAGSTHEEATPARLFELDADGRKVWQAWFESSDPAVRFGSYAAERIPALVDAP